MERISQLLYKHLRGNLTDAERAELMTWAAADPANWELLNRVLDEEDLEAGIRDWYVIPKRSVTDDPRLDAAITANEMKSKHSILRLIIRRALPYTAAIIALALIGLWYTYRQDHKMVTEQAIDDTSTQGNKAVLTLADGRKIDLSEERSGIVVEKGHITYDDGSSLTVLPDIGESVQTISQLELSTPRGGTYQMILPDGSKVWLNAASTIKYPSNFIGKERIVEISGEAYFDIKNDRQRPFKVLSKNQEIDVLGTEFNIAAYPDEREIRTTLVDGKIRLSVAGSGETKSSKTIILMPGEQGALSNGHFLKSRVDVSEYVAWKDGFFYFNRTPTSAAITQLARWYDLDVVYKGKLPEANLFAYIDRNKPLSAVLKALEKSELKLKIVQNGQRKQLIILGGQ
ncbi:FecR domain-containing protein [Olivibacter sp. CPCC 100613]|uniref:FecR family protein n=1 Tax=Olivibacter sp. CPCC 100613 TaxID=3079931 RepID=UPI002FF87613